MAAENALEGLWFCSLIFNSHVEEKHYFVESLDNLPCTYKVVTYGMLVKRVEFEWAFPALVLYSFSVFWDTFVHWVLGDYAQFQ